MTKHIVFFKFKAEVSENVRTSAFKAFKDGIERLPSEIPFIREVFVGRNCNEAEKWDVCLHRQFGGCESLQRSSFTQGCRIGIYEIRC